MRVVDHSMLGHNPGSGWNEASQRPLLASDGKPRALPADVLSFCRDIRILRNRPTSLTDITQSAVRKINS